MVFFIIFNIIFFMASISIVLFGLRHKSNHNNSILTRISNNVEGFMWKRYSLIALSLFLLTLFTTTYMLGSVPYGLHVDEAGMAYDAWSLSQFGVDRYLNQFPVYLINFGGGQSAMYAYLTAPLIDLFGYSATIIRLPAVIIHLLMFASVYWLMKEEKDKTKSLLFLFLITIVPYFIMQARWGLDCNLLVGFLTIAIVFLMKSITKHKNIYLFLSGIFFGLSLYTYALSYLIIPILILLVAIYLLYLKKWKIKHFIIFGIPIFLLAIPLLLLILVNNGFLPQIDSLFTIPLLPGYRGTEISFLNIFQNSYIFLSLITIDNPLIFKNILFYNALPYFGSLYYISIPFVIIGFIVCFQNSIQMIKQKQFHIDVIMIFWFTSVMICQLLIYEPNINKANAIFIPLVYFVACGILRVIKKADAYLLPILFLFFVNFCVFFGYYFYHYNNYHINHQPFYATHYLDTLEYSKTLDKNHIYVEGNIAVQKHIYVLLLNFVSPYHYDENEITISHNNHDMTYHFFIPKEIQMDAVYIIHTNSTTFETLTELGFEAKSYGHFSVLSR